MALSDRLVRCNPLLGRYAFVQLRPLSVGISAVVYATIVALILVFNRAGEPVAMKFWKHSFVSLAVFQTLSLWLLGMYNVGSAYRAEIVEKSMDFFRLLPMSASRKIVGILVGRNLILLVTGVINTLLLLACGWMGGVSMLLVVEFLVFTWVVSAAAMLLSLLSSTQETTSSRSEGPKILFVLGIFMFPYIASIAFQWNEFFPRGAYVPFFLWRLRMFPFLTFWSLFLGGCVVTGLIRRFRDEQAPFFTTPGILGIGLVLHALYLGLFWPYLTEHDIGIPEFGLGMACLLFTAFSAFRKWDDYLESYSRKGALPGLSGFNLSNLVPAAGMTALWTAFFWIAAYRAGWVVPPASLPVAVSFWLVLFALAEVGTLYAVLGRHVVLLGWFLAILYTFLPLIAAAVFKAKDLVSFSAFGYFFLFSEKTGKGPSGIPPLVVNVTLLSVLLVLIFRRYKAIGRPGSPPA